MSELANFMTPYVFHVHNILACLRRDWRAIFLLIVFMALFGGAFGYKTAKATSHAQVVMSPMPLQANRSKVQETRRETSDEFEMMLAAPLDVKSTSLLCESDEVLERTLDEVNVSGALTKPVKNLAILEKMLSFRVTIDKETPYDVTYTPLLELTAKTKVPSDAKLIVNTWAKTLSEVAKKYQDALQLPAETALDDRMQELQTELMAAEMESEKFWTENNVLYLETRLNEIAGLMVSLQKERTKLKSEVAHDEAAVESFASALEQVKPKIELEWKLSPELLGTLGPKLGIGVGAQGGKDKSAEASPNILSVESVNAMYWDTKGHLVATRAEGVAKKKQLDELDSLIADLDTQRLDYQAQFATATTGRLRAERKLDRMDEAYTNIALKREYAQVAGRLNHPPLQIISQGTEWPQDRRMRAVMFAFPFSLLGFLAATCLSIIYRMAIKPALDTLP